MEKNDLGELILETLRVQRNSLINILICSLVVLSVAAESAKICEICGQNSFSKAQENNVTLESGTLC